jgi:hypothetical protein
LNLFFPPQTPSLGDLSPVYRRAELSRILMLVGAPLRMAVPAGGSAREFGGTTHLGHVSAASIKTPTAPATAPRSTAFARWTEF